MQFFKKAKRALCVWLLVAMVAALASGCAKEPCPAEQEYAQVSTYTLDLFLNPDDHTMVGNLCLDFFNAETDSLAELRFYIFPNSFARESYGVFDEEDMESAYPHGFSSGSLVVQSVTQGGEKLNWRYGGEQNQVLVVEFQGALEPGQSVAVDVAYTVTIPQSLGRFGYSDKTFSLVNCNPILAVYDQGRWFDEYLYYPVGDPFYSDVANYKGTVRMPKGYDAAVTGTQQTTKDSQTGEVYIAFDAPMVRDFGFVASDQFVKTCARVGDVLVTSYAYRDTRAAEARLALETGKKSVRFFSSLFGQYAYRELDVVQCGFFIGGMEYPGMVLIDDSQYTPESRFVLETVVAHETAHQWWYAALGNNQVTEPWLDEALTDYSTELYMVYKNGGKPGSDPRVGRLPEGLDTMISVWNPGGSGIDAPVTAFPNNTAYSLVVYYQGRDMFAQLCEELTPDVFFEALRQYYEDNLFGIVSRTTLVTAFEKQSGRKLDGWFDSRLNPAS